jgi:hypothetical protein
MANYISSISKTHQTLVGSPELVAWNNGWISKAKLYTNCASFKNSKYFSLLLDLIQGESS